MYCPMKLYIKTHVDTRENEDYQLAIEIKKLKIDTTSEADFYAHKLYVK